MTDKHLSKNVNSMCQVIHAVLISKNIFFPGITAFQQKTAFFIFRYTAFILK